MSTKIIFAGFGGQGVQFVAKVTAYAGMIDNKEVSWLPSYGPEMRGGTSNCSVCIDDSPIACPIVNDPDILMALNTPSFDKFEPMVVPGGTIVYDSSLINKESARTDINCKGIPATKLAKEKELSGLANMIALGYMLKLTNFMDADIIKSAIEKMVPASKTALVAKNIEAINLGFNYAE